MNRFQEAVLSFAGRVVPGLGRMMESAAQRAVMQEQPLKERFLELEMALDNVGWVRETALAGREFSRPGLESLIRIARIYSLKNPIVKRAVKISSFYVFGRGFTVTTDDDTATGVIEDFFDLNKKELNHMGMVEKDQTLRTDGNLFIVLVPQPGGAVKIRTVDALEIGEKITDPDDASSTWFYRRIWTADQVDPVTGIRSTQQVGRWYPDIDYIPPQGPKQAMIGQYPIEWETPVMHIKVGGHPKWHWGCPEVYATLDWARAYKEFLESWKKITAALAAFAWDIKTPGGNQAIQGIASALGSSVGTESGRDFLDRNPPPLTGSAFASGQNTTINPIKTAGATTEPEQGRRILLMAAAADGLPETFYGDASTGSLATAQSLDRPTELQFLERQELWREVLQRLCDYVLQHSSGTPKGLMREALKGAGKLRVRYAEGARRGVPTIREAKQPQPGDVTISVVFPDVLEHDVAQMVNAIATAATLNGYTPADTIDPKTLTVMLLQELGVEDPKGLADAMYPDAKYSAEVPDKPDPAAAPPTPGPIPLGQHNNPRESALLTMVSDLKRTCETLLTSKTKRP